MLVLLAMSNEKAAYTAARSQKSRKKKKKGKKTMYGKTTHEQTHKLKIEYIGN